MIRPTRNALVLPGGGVRGRIQARNIDELHRRTGFLDHVDMAVGTSTGGLVAFGIAAKMAPSVMIDLYGNEARRIFPRSRLRRLATVGGLVAPMFSRTGLDDVLRDVFGDLRFGEIGRSMVTSRNITKRKSKVWSNRANDPDCEQLVRDLAGATSSAPVYFAPKRILHVPDGEPCFHIDGGVFANDPTGAALAEMVVDGFAIDQMNVLVIGTGSPPAIPPPWWSHLLPWGLIRCMVGYGLVSDLIDGPADHVHTSSRRSMTAARGSYCLVQASLPVPIDLADASRVGDLDEIAAAMNLEPAVEWIAKEWNRRPDGAPPLTRGTGL